MHWYQVHHAYHNCWNIHCGKHAADICGWEILWCTYRFLFYKDLYQFWMVGHKISELLSHPLEVSVLHIHAALKSCGQLNGFSQDLMHRFCGAPWWIQEHNIHYAMDINVCIACQQWHACHNCWNIHCGKYAADMVGWEILWCTYSFVFMKIHAGFRWCVTKSL